MGFGVALLSVLAAAAPSSWVDDLHVDVFQTDMLGVGGSKLYRLLVSRPRDIKVVLLPLSGNVDAFVSLDANETLPSVQNAARSRSWTMSAYGAEELLLRRHLFISECYVYVRVSALRETTYRVGVIDSHDAFSSKGGPCSPGCIAELLTNERCDASCNTTRCAFDRGACLRLQSTCALGCDSSWLADGYCDEACFTEECKWDMGDCVEGDVVEGCADTCLSDYIDDGECDVQCNVPSCLHDGADCAHGHTECYEVASGSDYRGKVNVTVSGLSCQRWSAQYPNQHFFTHARYPAAGLGGHSSCRNPGGMHTEPWCYTTDPLVRWERCDVGPRASSCAVRTPHHPTAKLRGPSACERRCPHAYALALHDDCAPLEECSVSATGDHGAHGEGGEGGMRWRALYLRWSRRLQGQLLSELAFISERQRESEDADDVDGADGMDGASALDDAGGDATEDATLGMPSSSKGSAATSIAAGAFDGGRREPIASPMRQPSVNSSSTVGVAAECYAAVRACHVRRAKLERLTLVLWASLVGTACFLLSLLVYAYRLMRPLGSSLGSSPLGTPRAWASGVWSTGAYDGVVMREAACEHAHAGRSTALEEAERSGLLGAKETITLSTLRESTRGQRERELLAAEHAILLE